MIYKNIVKVELGLQILEINLDPHFQKFLVIIKLKNNLNYLNKIYILIL